MGATAGRAPTPPPAPLAARAATGPPGATKQPPRAPTAPATCTRNTSRPPGPSTTICTRELTGRLALYPTQMNRITCCFKPISHADRATGSSVAAHQHENRAAGRPHLGVNTGQALGGCRDIAGAGTATPFGTGGPQTPYIPGRQGGA